MIQFYSPDFADTHILPESESGHCVRVLRKGEGDIITVSDGKGRRYEARIVSANPRKVEAEIIKVEEIHPHWPARIVLCVAPTKNLDRMEWLLEKATEIGVDEIIPLLCAHSERKVLKTERLDRILVSAMKQSLKSVKPVLHELTPLKDVLRRPFEGQKFVAYCDADTPRKNFACELRPDADVMIFIGPEGDFSPAEISAAMAAGVVPVSFGESRMRTETAALFAVQAVHIAGMINKCGGEGSQS